MQALKKAAVKLPNQKFLSKDEISNKKTDFLFSGFIRLISAALIFIYKRWAIKP